MSSTYLKERVSVNEVIYSKAILVNVLFRLQGFDQKLTESQKNENMLTVHFLQTSSAQLS